MQKDDLVYLGHMLDMARKAVEKIGGKDRFEFDQDENLRMALLHLVQIIGEAGPESFSRFSRGPSGNPLAQNCGHAAPSCA